MRGTITQGDLASWISPVPTCARHAGAPRLRGRPVVQRCSSISAATPKRWSRCATAAATSVSLYAYDTWTMTPRSALGYGAKYARYDYLADRALFSPRASITIRPLSRDSLTRPRDGVASRDRARRRGVHAAVGRPVAAAANGRSRPCLAGAFRPERLDHVEMAAEREWAGEHRYRRARFRQRVEDQVVTLFGVAAADMPARHRPLSRRHPPVTSMRVGWGVSVSRARRRRHSRVGRLHAGRTRMVPLVGRSRRLLVRARRRCCGTTSASTT